MPNQLPYILDDRRDDGRSTHRVAITVFCTAKGAYRIDATHAATMAIRHALGTAGTYGALENGRPDFHIEAAGKDSMFVPNHCYLAVDVHEVIETGMAAGNGLLWLEPTLKAYPREDND